MLNKVCYCSITSDYISDNTLQCDSEHTVQMRARLSAISNYTTSQLLTILQNWTADSSEIIVDGQTLTVTFFYFLSNDSTPTQTSNNETSTKNNMILFSAIGSAGGLSFFLCICCIIISVCLLAKFKFKKIDHLKIKLVVCIILKNNVVIIIYTENKKSKKEKIRIKISAIWQQEQTLIMSCTHMIMITMIFPQIGIRNFCHKLCFNMYGL